MIPQVSDVKLPKLLYKYSWWIEFLQGIVALGVDW